MYIHVLLVFFPQDVDAYIHRSGRTGRAGKTGVCVMLYKPAQEYQIPHVERKSVSIHAHVHV